MPESFRRPSEPPFLRRAREALGGDSDLNETEGEAVGDDPAGEPRDRADRPASDSAGTTDLRRSVSGAAARIQDILDAAERAASDIQAEAHEEADRYLERRKLEADERAATRIARLDNVLDTLREHLAKLEQDGTAMVAVLEEAIARVEETDIPADSAPEVSVRGAQATPLPTEAEEERAPEPAQPEPAYRPQALAPVAYPGTGASAVAEEGQGESGDSREAALIRATQMAVRGVDRAGIEEALRSEFGLTDPAPIVNEILGAG